MTYIGIKIPVIESERGWGSKVDDYMVCKSVEDALDFMKEFNSKNNENTTPDWYMYCSNNPEPINLSKEQYVKMEESENSRNWLSSLEKI